MEPKTFTFNETKPHTFTKSTNRKYFGTPATDNLDMKKSSILFTSTPKQETHSSFGTNTFKSKVFPNNQESTPPSENEGSIRTKSQTMYASMIVPKSQSNDFSRFKTSDDVKELNDKAQQLKKRLLQMAGKKNDKQDLVNKYLKPDIANPPEISSPFSKNRKTSDNSNASVENNINSGKLGMFLKPIKKQFDIPSNGQSSYSLSNHQVVSGYVSQSNKKSTFSNYNNYNSYSSPTSLNQASDNLSKHTKQEQKRMKKDDFQIGKKLGNGMFGQVFLVRHKKLRFVCALKILKKQMVRTQKVQDQLVRQIKIQFYLQRQNIINLYGFFSDQEHVYLLQELCMDGHLFSMLKVKQRFQDSEAADIIKQICQGLDYIHHERIIHRDIKPQNIIMHQGVAKICDFGWAVYRGDGLRGTYCGTPLYTPPELLRGQLYDQKFDIWAIGILAYQLIVGRFPFKIFCEDDIKRILTDQITFPFSVDVSAEAKNFILSIIRKNPQERIDIEEIINHPFLKNNIKKSMEIDFKL